MRLASSKIMPYACTGICKYLLALRPSRKLSSEAGEGLAAGRDRGVHETNTLVNC